MTSEVNTKTESVIQSIVHDQKVKPLLYLFHFRYKV